MRILSEKMESFFKIITFIMFNINVQLEKHIEVGNRHKVIINYN